MAVLLYVSVDEVWTEYHGVSEDLDADVESRCQWHCQVFEQRTWSCLCRDDGLYLAVVVVIAMGSGPVKSSHLYRLLHAMSDVAA